MKVFKIICSLILFSMMFLIGIKTHSNFNVSRDSKNDKNEKEKLKKIAEDLNNCFDLKNKSQRTLKESMLLIEYCLKEY